MFYYSKSTNGFYTKEIHGNNIPMDAVEITSEQHQQLLQGQTNGKKITSGENGSPVLVENTQEEPAEEIAARLRKQRDALLTKTDWIVIKSLEQGQTVSSEWKEYRQALRDITLQPEFPAQVNWPQSPQ